MALQHGILLLAIECLLATAAAAEEPPRGYRQVFAADFSGTTITPNYDGQWWYLLSGAENGRDWSTTKQLNGGAGFGFVIQPYMFARDIQPLEYQEARVMDEAGNKFLRFTNRKRDGQWKSRVQMMSSFSKAKPPIEGFYSRISFRIGADMQSKLQETWLDLIEVHDIGGGGASDLFRQGLYINPERGERKSYYRLQLRNETRDKVVYRMKLDEFKGWDRWETVGFQFESAAADRPALVRVWVNGNLLADKCDTPAGYPIRNFHPLKAYIDNSTAATVPFTIDVDNWEFYVKDR